MPIAVHCGLFQGEPVGVLHSLAKLETFTQAMTKSFAVITEAIRNPKHPFKKVDSQPKKEQKHRYERRKIREYLQLGDWVTEGT